MSGKTEKKEHLFARRSVMTALGGLVFTPTAFALAPPMLRLPASFLYVRVDKFGEAGIGQVDHQAWRMFASRLGGLVTRIEPIAPTKLLMSHAPEFDGGGAAVLSARTIGAQAGYDYIIIYGHTNASEIQPEKSVVDAEPNAYARQTRSKSGVKWIMSKFSKDKPKPTKTIFGEAHLFDVRGGGSPLASSWVEADNRPSWGILREKTQARKDIVTELALDMEQQVQLLARRNFRALSTIVN